MSELSRTSALASRHTALGSGLEDWNGMGTAWSYNSDPNDEHDAIRESDGMFNMSPLKKVFVRWPDAALLFYGYDMTDEHTPWEVGLGFSVNRNKGDFRGKRAVLASEGQERFVAAGISVDHNSSLVGGESLSIDGDKVGVLNSPCWPHRLNKSFALVHLSPGAAKPGTRLDVNSDEFTGSATVEKTPFFDPGKTRTHI